MRLGPGDLDALIKDKPRLRQKDLSVASGGRLLIEPGKSSVNGLIHIIDTVILPK